MRLAPCPSAPGLAFLAARVASTAALFNVARADAQRGGPHYWVRYTAANGITVETAAARGAHAALYRFKKALSEDAQHCY